MGLDINGYSYGYSVLQRLRKAALKVENNKYTLDELCDEAPLNEDNSQFPAFLFHSDCEGGYISVTNKTTKFVEIEPFTFEWFLWGHSLEKLKAECEILNKTIKQFLNEGDHKCWNDFY